MFKSKLDAHILFVNVTYITTIGVSGLILCALGSNLTDIASEIGLASTVLGGRLCLLRGLGCILGAVSSAQIYHIFHGDYVILCGLCTISIMLIIIPFSTTSNQLYVYFFVLGFCSAVDDTGCTLLTRKLRGKEAGPWLAMNGISFGMSAAIVPIIELCSNRFDIQYYILSAMVLCVAGSVVYGMQSHFTDDEVFLVLQRRHSEHDLQAAERRTIDEIAPHYNVEYSVGFMVFCFVGGQVDFVAYIKTYIEQSRIIDNADHVMALFWVFVSVGRLIGLFDQKKLTDDQLINRLLLCCVCGSSILLPLLILTQPMLFYISVCMYALWYGPTVAYCHDLNNRLTFPTEKSTSIVMFGLNIGASFVPFFTSLLWPTPECWQVLVVFLVLSMALPIITLSFVRAQSYIHTEVFTDTYVKLYRANSLYHYDAVKQSNHFPPAEKNIVNNEIDFKGNVLWSNKSAYKSSDEMTSLIHSTN